jgi:hypothetical protein
MRLKKGKARRKSSEEQGRGATASFSVKCNPAERKREALTNFKPLASSGFELSNLAYISHHNSSKERRMQNEKSQPTYI